MKRRPPAENVRRVQPIAGNLRYTITNKMGRTVQCESHLERRLALRLERDHTVKDYNSQPETYHFVDRDGKKHRYTPDFIAWLANGKTQIHEVTIPERRIEKNYSVTREAFGQEFCLARKWEYVIHTPETLPNDTETANLLYFYAYRSQSYMSPEIAQAILHVLNQQDSMPVCDLVRTIQELLFRDDPSKKAAIYTTIYHLIWHDEIQIDWSKLFISDVAHSRTARVWLKR